MERENPLQKKQKVIIEYHKASNNSHNNKNIFFQSYHFLVNLCLMCFEVLLLDTRSSSTVI